MWLSWDENSVFFASFLHEEHERPRSHRGSCRATENHFSSRPTCNLSFSFHPFIAYSVLTSSAFSVLFLFLSHHWFLLHVQFFVFEARRGLGYLQKVSLKNVSVKGVEFGLNGNGIVYCLLSCRESRFCFKDQQQNKHRRTYSLWPLERRHHRDTFTT